MTLILDLKKNNSMTETESDRERDRELSRDQKFDGLFFYFEV